MDATIAVIVLAAATLPAAALVALVTFNAVAAWRAQRLVPPVGRFATIGGTRLHFTDAGQGDAILLVHGLAAQLQTYTVGVTERLAADYRVIAVDRPGSGYSAAPVDATADSQAALLAGLLDHLAIDRALVVGHSLGGAVALALALNNPTIVAGLALVAPVTQAPPPLPGRWRRLAIQVDLVRWVLGWTVVPPLAAWREADFLPTLFSPDPVPADYRIRAGAALATRPWTIRNAARDMAEVGGGLAALQARYAALAMPIHVLFGRGDRILDHHEHGERFRDGQPGVALTLVDGGHMVPVTQPDRTAAFIAEAADAAGLRRKGVT